MITKDCENDNNGNADDTDEADLHGFSFALGESLFGHELHEFSTNFVCAKAR
jgi:hypothetical protein